MLNEHCMLYNCMNEEAAHVNNGMKGVVIHPPERIARLTFRLHPLLSFPSNPRSVT